MSQLFRCRLVTSIVAIFAMLAPLPGKADILDLPEDINPPLISTPDCPAILQAKEPAGAFPPVPYASLAPGAAVEFLPASPGTGRSAEAPPSSIYDPNGGVLPMVPSSAPDTDPGYQRIMVKPTVAHPLLAGMIYANPTSATRGRIASLFVSMWHPPQAPPRLIIQNRVKGRSDCRPRDAVQVYATAMTVDTLKRLSGPSGCRWIDLAACKPEERPHGQVLFVQSDSRFTRFEHLWIDYDLLRWK